jgi:uncharacterized membrane protein YeaQ/YmgE (transglycosylase-associated protein family)
MPLFVAAIDLMPGGIIAWIVVGLVSGWLAGIMMKGGGYGMIGDLLVGLVGSLVGGFLMGFFLTGVEGFWGSIFVSFLGACAFIAISRALSGRRVA